MGGLGTLGLWLFLAVVVVMATALAVGMIWLADRVLSDSVGQESNSAMSPFVTCVALVFGAVLGFTVVVAWEQFSSASTHVTNEASTLTTLYRQTAAMDAPEQTQLRNLLRTYTIAVKVQNGTGKRKAAQASPHEPQSQRCITCSVTSRPATRRSLTVNSLAS